MTQKELEKNEASKLFDDTEKVATELNVDQLDLELKSSDVPNINEFEEKSLMINPEPPEQIEEDSLLRQEDTELGVNPPNPNFKPIPELKPEFQNSSIDDHYSDIDDKEIKPTDTDEFSVLPNIEENDANDNEDEINSLKSPSATEPEETNSEKLLSNKDSSAKKSEFLAPMPELSKWERDESTEKLDDVGSTSSQQSESFGESKSTTEVTRDVLKRAENAIFQKAINAIRPIEIKKISENRKILYQNPEPKVFEPELNRDVNKSLNVTVNIGKNERNVEITESSKKGKIDRSKFKLNESHSPTRLSAKERLGEKIDDEKDKKITLSSVNNDRKVFIDDSKSRSRGKDLSVKNYHSGRSSKNDKERERQIQTPPPLISKHTNESEETHHHLLKRKRDQEDSDDKDDKKKHGDKKRKKEHRSRSKSREHKKRKEKKHKKDKFSDRKQKHKESSVKRDKQSLDSEDKSNLANINSNQELSPARKHQQQHQQPKNPKSISDRKRSVLDEASFEPDYSASDSDSDNEDNKTSVKKTVKADEQQQFDLDKEVCVKVTKRRVKSTSSDDNSNSSVSSSTESDSSDDSSYRRRKKKHKKHKKRKVAKKESSSELDSDSDSTQSSSEEEKHKKKSKKSKSKKKQLKKKKKSKHK